MKKLPTLIIHYWSYFDKKAMLSLSNNYPGIFWFDFNLICDWLKTT